MGQAKIKQQRQKEEQLRRELERRARNTPKKRRAFTEREVIIRRTQGEETIQERYSVQRDGAVYLKTGRGIRRVSDPATLEEVQEAYTALYNPPSPKGEPAPMVASSAEA